MTQLLERADAAESMPEAVELGYEDPATHRLMKLCRELQRASGKSPFFLSCRTAGGLLGISHNVVAQRLQVFLVDKVLDIAEPHTEFRATRYRYLLRL